MGWIVAFGLALHRVQGIESRRHHQGQGLKGALNNLIGSSDWSGVGFDHNPERWYTHF
jgi:hypothetical protein